MMTDTALRISISQPPKAALVLLCMVLASCSGTKEVAEVAKEGYHSSPADGKMIADRLPDYTDTLHER